MSEQKEYTNEMHGALFAEDNPPSEKHPRATGTVTISGVELRIAMWPARVAGGTGKAAGKKYWPISVEYKQGTKFVLAKVSPSNIVVTGGTATAEGADAGSKNEPAQAATVDDMPF